MLPSMSNDSAAAERTASNAPPILTVSELAGAVRHAIEDQFGMVRVRGELSGVKRAGSGHVYMGLKDADSVLDAVAWRGTAQRLAVKPEDGLDVVVIGRLTTYPARSRYQLIVEQMELAGEGALLKMIEERRKRLAAEGLFDAGRKRKLPYLPEVIGVVTSPSGAVIRDILHRLAERLPCHVLLWPVLVQGNGAAEQVAAAVAGFSALTEGGAVPRPDVVIVARGGGSLEDLMAFNEEVVVRAIAASTIPVISAVGHETDTTLADFAADMRAPTPTAAAELAVPVRADLLVDVDACGVRLAGAAMKLVRHRAE
ncbi:MAG: exodeoxyribonuclease VII large subunit, partial [Alphaproteobacteria bacterium]|nr:exodeoxyribonuclease VII large subunit [Alphaproteobacteria bacterium]